MQQGHYSYRHLDIQNISFPRQVFKLDWLLMSIVLLCIMAMGLYSLINLLERLYQKRI